MSVQLVPEKSVLNKFKLGTDYQSFLKKNRYDINATLKTPYNEKLKVLPCDQTASSFPLKCVEAFIQKYVFPFYSNTHSNNFMGRYMSKLISESKNLITELVNAPQDKYAVLFTGSGSSGAINHLVHIIKPRLVRSVVIASINEHYSNLLPWYHNADRLFLLDTTPNGLYDLAQLHALLKEHSDKSVIVSVSACSNVTGVIQNVKEISRLCRLFRDTLCFFDHATSAPYVDIDASLCDAVFISPHKFPGGISSPGVLIVRKNIACNDVTYTPSGGTVTHMCVSKGPFYSEDFETRESGGTPNIIGIVRVGLAFKISRNFRPLDHELELTNSFQNRLVELQRCHPRLQLLNPLKNTFRLPIFALQITPHHYNLIVTLLCDLFGITVRGGVSCSGVLAEKLLNVDSNKIIESIKCGKGMPSESGWVRLTLSSIHTKRDIDHIINAIDFLCRNIDDLAAFYRYDAKKNVFYSNLCEDGFCVTGQVPKAPT
jgi:selenocysteine lyase/cysteine desulfurase